MSGHTGRSRCSVGNRLQFVDPCILGFQNLNLEGHTLFANGKGSHDLFRSLQYGGPPFLPVLLGTHGELVTLVVAIKKKLEGRQTRLGLRLEKKGEQISHGLMVETRL